MPRKTITINDLPQEIKKQHQDQEARTVIRNRVKDKFRNLNAPVKFGDLKDIFIAVGLWEINDGI